MMHFVFGLIFPIFSWRPSSVQCSARHVFKTEDIYLLCVLSAVDLQ